MNLRTGWKFESDRDYFKNSAFNASYLSEIYNWRRYLPYKVADYPEKRSYLIGRAVHLFALQLALFYKLVYYLKYDGKTKEGKAERANYEKMQIDNPDIIILSKKEYDSVLRMGEAIQNDSEAQEWLSGCVYEGSGYKMLKMVEKGSDGQIKPLFIKSKYDARKPLVIADIKTTKCQSKWEWQSDVHKYNYDLKAEFYKYVANTIEKHENKDTRYLDFVWILVQKESPYRVICYKMSFEDGKIGEEKFHTAMRILVRYYSTGEIDNVLETPGWKMDKFKPLFR